MKLHPDTLKEAHHLATHLDYETKDGGLGVDYCPECSERVFVIEGRSSDGAINYGYCMNPECRFKLSEEGADEDALAARTYRSD